MQILKIWNNHDFIYVSGLGLTLDAKGVPVYLDMNYVDVHGNLIRVHRSDIATVLGDQFLELADDGRWYKNVNVSSDAMVIPNCVVRFKLELDLS